MPNKEKSKKPEDHNHESILLFVCFLISSILGYAITHHIALL